MLYVEGHPILSQGEFSRMARGVTGVVPGLTAWWAGEPVGPIELWAALHVGARLGATKDAEVVIDLALDRLEQAFPELPFPQRPA